MDRRQCILLHAIASLVANIESPQLTQIPQQQIVRATDPF